MKQLLLLLILFTSSLVFAQPETDPDITSLHATPTMFNDNRQSTELDINFQAKTPADIASVAITLASDRRKTGAVTITLTDTEFRLWTRKSDNLHVIICPVKVPDTLVGNCRYAEVKVTKKNGASVTLDTMVF